jgi:hypothetical protein
MRRRINLIALSVLGAALTLCSVAITAITANAAAGSSVTLYADQKTGQVFYKPCRRCVRLGTYVPAGEATEEIERRVEMKTQQQLEADRAQMKAESQARQLQQQQWNAEMAKQVGEIQPFAREFGDRWYKKISIGALVYMDYSFFSHTGFGPQYNENIFPPGPGNNSFNSFDVTRVYLDTRWTPVDDISFRITPEVFRQLGTVAAHKEGRISAINSNVDGNLSVRMKYAYLDYNTFFKKILNVPALSEDKFTFGEEQNPFIDWEENLWGYRYASLVPWNFISLSSSQLGASMKGPIKFHELQYADYDFGAFNNTSFRAFEQTSTKQVMGRLTLNPFGVKSRYAGLGLTGFFDYGYSNNTPDNTGTTSASVPPIPLAFNAAANGHITRTAVVLSYQAETWQFAGEWDYGHNAFSAANFFSGSGPQDEFNPTFGTAPKTSFLNFTKMTNIFLNNGQAIQQGWDFFGHWDIPHTPFDLFGLFQQWLPNTRVSTNPLDFQRYIAGVEWKVNKYLRIAIDGQSTMYYHDQMTVPAAEIGRFTHFTTKKGGKNPAFDVIDAVPRDTHAFFLNFEFRY